MAKPYLSATRLQMHGRCPAQYGFRYVRGLKVPPRLAQSRGSALHHAAAENFRQKIESGRDLPRRQIVELAVESLRAEMPNVELTRAEQSVGRDVVTGDAIDDIAELADTHAARQAPEYRPVLVEQQVRIELPGAHDLLGVLDLADADGRVVDFKTSKRRLPKGEADSSVQLSIYAAAYRAVLGAEPSGLRLDVLVQTSKSTTRQLLETTRGDADMLALGARIDATAKAIQSGSFPPCAAGSWCCSEAWCGYWRICPFVNSERSALVDLEG